MAENLQINLRLRFVVSALKLCSMGGDAEQLDRTAALKKSRNRTRLSKSSKLKLRE
jgi:hypothetical protein